jgi:hypothetical protein
MIVFMIPIKVKEIARNSVRVTPTMPMRSIGESMLERRRSRKK